MSWDFPYDSQSAIATLLKDNGLAMSKKFGQNFLLPLAIRQRIVALLGPISGKRIWEIGPGIGSLTSVLLEAHAQVTAFEIDHGFCRILREKAFVDEPSFHLVESDVLKSWKDVYEREGTPDAICSNLPYNVGSLCIASFIEGKCLPSTMVVTLQKEVADRLCASAGSPGWSTLSILAQMEYAVSRLFSIKGGAFYPPTSVSSTVVLMRRLFASRVPEEEHQLFLQVVSDLFAQRRKTVKNNLLAGAMGALVDKDGIEHALRSCQIPFSERSENLSFETIQNLALAFRSIIPSTHTSSFPYGIDDSAAHP